MPTGLMRYNGKGDLHFITFSCYRRMSLLKTAQARDIFVSELGKVRDEMEFPLLGYVVMPEHVHLLIGEPKQGTPSSMLQKLKLRVSCKMHKEKEGTCAEPPRLAFRENGEVAPQPFWQARFYDFNVHTRGKKIEKLNYMHANPVKRRLVEHPEEWPWSSWSFYRKGERGLVRIDVE